MDGGVDMTPELDQMSEEERKNPRFTSLEEYYTRIGNLASLHSANVKTSENNEGYSKYSKYLMLPMDEIHGNNVFSIDPNSRVINVPASISRNGVSITGDELAETLLFEIDRFFDTTDLVTTDIYIQWTNPAGQEGASKITMVDYNSKPGKLLFGWPLTSKVTVENANQTNGQLKFAVRFFKREAGDSGRITYSLNTLPATVVIKQALYTNWNDLLDIDDPAAELAIAIENGPASDGPSAELPVIYMNLEAIAYLDEGDADEDKDSVNLQIRAVTKDSGVRRYEWIFKPSYIVDNKIVLGTSQVVPKQEEYVLTTDIAYNADKKYYKNLGEGGFKTYDPDVDGDFAVVKGGLYEPCSNLLVAWKDGKHVTGTYTVKAYNRVGKSEVSKESAIVTIPHPTEIKFSEKGDLKANAWLTANSETGALNNETLRVTTEATPGNTSTIYKWEYTDTFNGVMSEVMTEPDDEGISVAKSISSFLELNEPGWYRVTATASLNKEELYTTSSTCRVLAPIEAPVIYPDRNKDGDEQKAIDIADGEETTLKVELKSNFDSLLKSDNVTYQWYRNKPDMNGTPVSIDDEDVKEIDMGELTIIKKANDEFETFYCVVTNHLADKTASTTSSQFIIV